MSSTLASPSPPTTAAEVVETVRSAIAAKTPLRPVGGGRSLDLGVAARVAALDVPLTGLRRLIDYPARDMTVTVEAGMTIAELTRTLTEQRQRLPIDAPHANVATIGGLIATNFSGPRRYAAGTMRDYVIGISAVDGHATLFKAGGRVVKNVAGYDLCKLLVGSHGSLAIITQVTLKVRPQPESALLVACDLASAEQAEHSLAALVHSRTTPVAIELLAGPAWSASGAVGAGLAANHWRLVVGLEGTEPEVRWMRGQLRDELAPFATGEFREHAQSADWQPLIDFPATAESPLVMKISVVPSRVVSLMQTLQHSAPGVSLLAHAGSGIVLARFSELSATTTKSIVQQVQPAVAAAQGSSVVWSCPTSEELTPLVAWGPPRADRPWMQQVKQQFDPHGLFNPGRFVFA